MRQIGFEHNLPVTQLVLLRVNGSNFLGISITLQCGVRRMYNVCVIINLNEQAGMMQFWEWYRIFLGRVFGAVRIPRHAGSVATFIFLGSVACFAMVAGGYTLQTLQFTGSFVGLGVDKIEIKGNNKVSDIDVFQALQLEDKASLPMLDINKAQANLAALPWVEKVSVRKVYPDRIMVHLTEKKPFAVCQKNGVINIVDAQGNAIVPYNAADAHGLPFFVGEGSAKNAQEFLKNMEQFPDIKNRVDAYIRVADRRWDILLDNGVRIKLPENKPFERLQQAEDIDRRDGLFSRDIKTLDLRLEDRVTVALSDGAYGRYIQSVEAAKRLERVMKAANNKNGGRV